MDFTRPLTAGAVVSTSFRVLVTRPLLLCGLAATPLLVWLAMMLLTLWAVLRVVAGWYGLFEVVGGDPWGMFGEIVGYVVAFAALTVVLVVVQAKVTAMQTAAAAMIVRGEPTDLRRVWKATRGYLPRWLVLGLLFGGVLTVLYGALFAVIVLPSTLSRGELLGGLSTLLGVLLSFGLLGALVFVSVRLSLVIPVMVLEGHGPIDALRRAWQLTAGAFGRTLGHYLLGGLVGGAASYAVNLLFQGPLLSRLGGADQDSSLNQILAAVGSWLVLTLAVQLLAQIFTASYLPVHLTVMYLDELSRRTGPAAHWHPGGPGYGQPQQPYPVQPNPQQYWG